MQLFFIGAVMLYQWSPPLSGGLKWYDFSWLWKCVSCRGFAWYRSRPPMYCIALLLIVMSFFSPVFSLLLTVQFCLILFNFILFYQPTVRFYFIHSFCHILTCLLSFWLLELDFDVRETPRCAFFAKNEHHGNCDAIILLWGTKVLCGYFLKWLGCFFCH